MAAEKKMAQRHRIEFTKNIANGEKIAQRLGHLFLIDVEKAGVNPIARQGLAEGAFGLGDFVLMMRKNQIATTAVNVKWLAQIFRAHGRTFDMPARPPGTPRAIPSRLARLARFPQGEIQRRALALIYFHPRAGFEFIDFFARQFAVIGEARNRVIHVAVDPVGESFGCKLFNDGDDLSHMLGGARFPRRPQPTQALPVLGKLFDVAAGDGVAAHVLSRWPC